MVRAQSAGPGGYGWAWRVRLHVQPAAVEEAGRESGLVCVSKEAT